LDPSGHATIEGVVRAPSAFSITLASAPSMIATQELVVPKSIPITSPALLEVVCVYVLALKNELFLNELFFKRE